MSGLSILSGIIVTSIAIAYHFILLPPALYILMGIAASTLVYVELKALVRNSKAISIKRKRRSR